MIAKKESFRAFTNRVLNALRLGNKVAEKDIKILENILKRERKRSLILASALLSALNIKENEEEYKRFAQLIELANLRISENREPFTNEEIEELRNIFYRNNLNEKVVKKFLYSLTDSFTMELRDLMRNKNKIVKPKKEKDEEKKIETTEKEKIAL